METSRWSCTGLGIIIAVSGGSIWFLMVAFQESVLWGLGCLSYRSCHSFFSSRIGKTPRNPSA